MIQSSLGLFSCDPRPESHMAALPFHFFSLTSSFFFSHLVPPSYLLFKSASTGKCWMHIALLSIPIPVHWAPCHGPYSRRPVLYPFSAWAAHRSPGYEQESQGAAQGGVQSFARFRVTSQMVGKKFSQRGSRHTLGSPERLPGGGMVPRQRSQGQKGPKPQLGEEEQGGLCRKEEQERERLSIINERG